MKAFNYDDTPTGLPGSWVDGVLMRIAPANPEYNIEIQRTIVSSSDLAPSASTYNTITTIRNSNVDMAGTTYFDPLPNIASWRVWYRYRSTLAGYSSSAWLTANSTNVKSYAESSLNGFYKTQAAFAATTTDAEGTYIDSDVQAYDGLKNQKLTKGSIQGVARHGQVINFSDYSNQSFNSNPIVVFVGGLASQPESKWSSDLTAVSGGTATGAVSSSLAQRSVYAADGLNGTGFTTKALLMAIGTPTTTVEALSSHEVTLTYTPSTGDMTVSCGMTVTWTTKYSGPWTATYTIAAEVSYDGGSNWSERGTTDINFTFWMGTDSDTLDGEINFSDSALVAGNLIRILVKSYSVTGAYVSYSDTLNDGNVTYARGAVPYYASKTPDSTTTVAWSAYGYV